MSALGERRLQHSDDPRRALVTRALELVAFHQGVVGGGADQVHRPAVRHVGEQRAERDGHRCPEVRGEPGDLLAEGSPAERRLGPEDEDHVGTWQRRRPHPDGRPHDLALALRGQSHMRPHGREIGVRIGIDLGEGGRRARLDEGAQRRRCSIARVVPPREGGHHHRVRERRFGEPTDVLHVDRQPYRCAVCRVVLRRPSAACQSWGSTT